MFTRPVTFLLAALALSTTSVMAQSNACPTGGHAVANLTATGIASAPGVGKVTLNWQPTTMGQNGNTGYVIVIQPPVFDYAVDPTILNPTNPSDFLVINSKFGTGIGQWTVQVPPRATSGSVPNLALQVPYSFSVWTADAYATYLNAMNFPANPFLMVLCMMTAVPTTTTVYPQATAAVWGFADTHTHPFANDAYDQGILLFYGAPFGPKDQVLTADRGCSPACPFPDAVSYIHQGLITGMHLQNVSPFGNPSAGWPDFDKFPSYNINLHQAMYSDWLYRAFLGGLRLIVAHAVNNEILCQLSFTARYSSGNSGNSICNDVATVDRQIADARAMETYLNAQCKVLNPPRCLGPNRGWFHIVSSPQDARATINAGQLAVVLGIEVDRIFGCSETPRAQPPYQDCSQDNLSTEAYIIQQVKKYHDLGVRHVFIAHLADSAFAGMAIYDSTEFFPWTMNNFFVNGGDFQTESCMQTGYGFNYNQHLGVLDPNSSPWTILKNFGMNPPVPGNYPVPTCNARGLQPLGRFLVKTLRQNGMIVDLDHLSLETWAGQSGLETQLTVGNGNYFPIVAGHTGPNALGLGGASERGLNDEQLTFLRRSGGLPAMGIEAGSASSHDVYESSQNTGVPNNCDSSTASYAQGYLYFVDSMGGSKNAAVAIASDQSLNNLVAPRFNLPGDPHTPWHTPNYGRGCDGNTSQAQQQSLPITFVQGPPLASNQPPTYYFAAAAGAGPNPPRIFLWTGERDYQLNPHRMWDFNADGLAHLGLYPELIQDLQNIGVKPGEMTPLYNSAERYITAWQAYSSLGNPDQNIAPQMGIVGRQVPITHVHRLYTTASGWADQDLTSSVSGPKAPADTRISSFADGFGEHVYYIGFDSHVHQLYFNNSSWSDQDLTIVSNGRLAQNGSGLSSFVDGFGEHAYYIGIDLHIHQLYFNNSSWSDQDLTNVGAGVPPNGSGLSSFADSFGEHVYYIGFDSHVHQLYFNNFSWSDQDLTSGSNGAFALPGFGLSSFADSAGEHVYYVAFIAGLPGPGHIHQLITTSLGWVDQDLTALARGALVIPPTGISSFADGAGEHVYYLGGDLHVHQLYFNNSSWSDQDLTVVGNGPSAQVGNSISSFADGFGEHVYYIGNDSHVHQLYFNNSSWSDQDLTKSTNGPLAPSAVGITSFASSDGEHVYYLVPYAP